MNHRILFFLYFCAALCLTHASARAKSAKELRVGYEHVGVTIHGDLAKTTVTQVLINGLDHEVEAVFRYPVPADATVTEFGEWRGGLFVAALVQGAKEAKTTYDKAVERGEKAVIAGSSGENLFEMSVYGVPSKGMRRVRLEYVQTLSGLGGERHFILPRDRKRGMIPSASDLSVHIHEDRPIRAVDSPNHPRARIRSSASEARIALNRMGQSMKKDLVVRWQRSLEPLDLDTQVARVAIDEGGFMVTRFAFDRDPIPEASVGRDIVILIDASLSMAGTPFSRAQQIAHEVVDSSQSGDRIDVLVFNDEVQSAYGGLRPLDTVNKGHLHTFIDAQKMRGRSNLHGALKDAAQRLEHSNNGVVLLLTDGQPTVRDDGEDPFSFDPDVFKLSRARVVVGQFNYPHRQSALKAMLPNLTLRFIADGEGGDDILKQIVALTTATTITDFAIEFVGAQPEQVHGTIPDRLAVGENVRLVGRLDGATMVRITGFLHGEPIEVSQMIDIPHESPDDAGRNLAIEWARARVHDFEGRLKHESRSDIRRQMNAEIKYLGERFAIATSQTRFVLTDSLAPDRIKPGDPEIRIHTPESAQGVFGLLPWGERIECVWDDEEQLWLGRFLVPRGTSDGLYRVRVFVEQQDATHYRGALFFRVDSTLPEFELVRTGSGPITIGTSIQLTARPKALPAGVGGDIVVPDPIDIKRATVRLNGSTIELKRSDDGRSWTGEVPVGPETGPRTIELFVSDYARNFRRTTLVIEVVK